MRACRFLSLLIVAVALDLAVPVAPTPTGVEFEEDEEVLHIGGGVRIAKPAPAPARRPEAATESTRQTLGVAVRRTHTALQADTPRTHVARSSPLHGSPAPASPGEDH